MEYKFSSGKLVMTIFYEVGPSDVRNQSGEFGRAFEATCDGKTDEEKQRWRQALTQVAVIAGEHSVSWTSEAEMISKIIMNISNELPSTDFDQLVGIEAHVAMMKSKICLQLDDVKIVGIWGPAGIGKTTIARAIYNQISSNFQLKLYKGPIGKGGARIFGLKDQLISEILDHRDMKIPNFKEAEFRLKHQRVLLVLDGFNWIELQTLQKLFQSLRYGCKVIVTNEDLKTLKNNGINQIYKVAFPSSEEALQIFSYSAFGQRTPPRAYLEHAVELAKLISPFPLGLKVLGSALRGKRLEEWTLTPAKLKTYLDGNDTENMIRFAYDGLLEKHKILFHSLADPTLWGKNVNNAIYSLAERDWDVEKGIQTLADMALVSISGEGELNMQPLVQLMSSSLHVDS